MRAVTVTACALAALSLAVILSGCGETEVISRNVSGNSFRETAPAAWSGVTPLNTKSRYYLSIAHDADALYLRIVLTQSWMQRLIMRSGLVVWVDPKGGNDKSFGIRYPLGKEGGMPGGMDFDGAGPDTGEKNALQGQAGLEMEILEHDGKNTERMLISQGEGIRVTLTRAPEEFAYTLRVPFDRFPDLAGAITAGNERKIGIGIELVPPKPPAKKPGEGSGGQPQGECGGSEWEDKTWRGALTWMK
jgi:hypothetical protein